MSSYRRANITGVTWCFTLVTYRRQRILCDDPVREALRDAIASVRTKRPFEIDAWVLLPDHFHCIWTLPSDMELQYNCHSHLPFHVSRFTIDLEFGRCMDYSSYKLCILSG